LRVAQVACALFLLNATGDVVEDSLMRCVVALAQLANAVPKAVADWRGVRVWRFLVDYLANFRCSKACEPSAAK
jgi:hypothetical protein